MTCVRWGIGVVLALAAAVAPAAQVQPRQMGGVGITVFEDSNYRGGNATFRNDEPDLGRVRMAGRISSLQVAPGELWEVCENTYYRGRCQVFSGTEPDLKRRNWNDRIASLRRVRNGGGSPGYPGYPGARPGITLYSDENFGGRAREITIATPSLGSFNDEARSVRVHQGIWELCDDSGYRDCRRVDRDVANLASLGLSGRVSSARPSTSGGYYPPSAPTGRSRLVLYDRPGYRGGSHTLDRPQAGLGSFNNRAQSAQVIGTWELCDGENFTGQCRVVSANVSNLSSIRLNNRVRSARPIGSQPR